MTLNGRRACKKDNLFSQNYYLGMYVYTYQQGEIEEEPLYSSIVEASILKKQVISLLIITIFFVCLKSSQLAFFFSYARTSLPILHQISGRSSHSSESLNLLSRECVRSSIDRHKEMKQILAAGTIYTDCLNLGGQYPQLVCSEFSTRIFVRTLYQNVRSHAVNAIRDCFFEPETIIVSNTDLILLLVHEQVEQLASYAARPYPILIAASGVLPSPFYTIPRSHSSSEGDTRCIDSGLFYNQ